MDNIKATTIFLSLGSNQGDRLINLENAIYELGQICGNIVSKSSIYETAAWGKTDQQDFLNQVVRLETVLSSDELLIKVLEVERSLGRLRVEKWGPRVIDIDILFFGNEIIVKPNLIVPHPEFSKRKFVLVPLHEIASAWIDPVSNRSISELLNISNDHLVVKRYSI